MTLVHASLLQVLQWISQLKMCDLHLDNELNNLPFDFGQMTMAHISNNISPDLIGGGLVIPKLAMVLCTIKDG